jgi:glycosyltransferase involved in cell wall biosynthesis
VRSPHLLFIRSGPLQVTPAIARYVSHLRLRDFAGRMSGLELLYREHSFPPLPIDALRSHHARFATTRERIFSLVEWQWVQLVEMLRARPDIIHITDIFSAVPALMAKLVGGAALIFDIRDNIRLSLRHRSRVAAELLGALESLTVLASDGVIVVSPALREELPASRRAHACVIPNAPLRDDFNGFRFSEDGAMRVNLSGFVSHRRNLAAWCAAQARDPALRLDLYGTVADAATARILDEAGLTCAPPCAHAEALERTRHADIVSLMYDPSVAINRYAAPNKLYEGLMLGKPIICATGMKMADELARWECGLAVAYGSPEALAGAIDRLRDPATRLRMGRNARRLFTETYAGMAARELDALYRRLGLIAKAEAPPVTSAATAGSG